MFDIFDNKGGSYIIFADSWQDAENSIPENHRVFGKVVEFIDIPDSEIYQIVRCQ